MTHLFFQELVVSGTRPEYEPSVAVADFEAIFDHFQRPITAFIYHSVRNREQANDLTQDTFVKAYKALLGGAEVREKALSAWLYRIAANTVTDTLRRRKLITWYPLSLFREDHRIGARMAFTHQLINEVVADIGPEHERSSSYTGGRFEDQVADRELLEQIFQQLPRMYAICLWLFEQEGLSCQEIGELFNISSSAVKMRLMRARGRAKRIFTREIDRPSPHDERDGKPPINEKHGAL